MTKLTTAAKYHQCSACLQLIVPGELYAAQRWAPWECHPDGDKMWFSQPACRWCAEHYWKTTHPQDGWWEEAAQEWASDECHRWLREVGVDYCLLPYYAREEYRKPLRTAQKQANAFMAFLRRFAKHAKPAAIRRGLGRPTRRLTGCGR